MKKITINKKGEKMRKFIMILLVAGVVSFAAAQAHAVVHTFQHTDVNGNHYKKADVLEGGAHGDDYQLSSAILKSLGLQFGATPGVTLDPDDAYGFTTSANPWLNNKMAGVETEVPFDVPKYTQPCPRKWLGKSAGFGNCEANLYATDPQTEDGHVGWDGSILDDMYTEVGVNDSSLTKTRELHQVLDNLFQEGRVASFTATRAYLAGTTSSNTRYFNVDDTLDQDLADYQMGNATLHQGEDAGIYGRLTQLFQVAGPVTGSAGGFGPGSDGCASAGIKGNDQNNDKINPCATAYATPALQLDAGPIYETADGTLGKAFFVDQWMVSEAYDYDYTKFGKKTTGVGIRQSYSQWFKDGYAQDWNYYYAYPAGHGTINKTVDKVHTGIDP